MKNKFSMKKWIKRTALIGASIAGIGCLAYHIGKNHGYSKAIVDLDDSVDDLQDKFKKKTGKFLAIEFDNETLGYRKGSTKINGLGVYHNSKDWEAKKKPIIGISMN